MVRKTFAGSMTKSYSLRSMKAPDFIQEQVGYASRHFAEEALRTGELTARYRLTGHSSDEGEHDNVLNVNLRERAGSDEFREAIENLILPKVDEYKPDLLLVSAGKIFD